MSTAIVDIQGFKRPNNQFVLKEFAIAFHANQTPRTFLFEAPCSWSELPPPYQKQNRWLQQHHHGLDWNTGSIPYHQIKTILYCELKNTPIIYVKGEEKRLWLREILKSDAFLIRNLEELGCPNLNNLLSSSSQCKHHSHVQPQSVMCAGKIVILLAKWLQTV